jgi:hypothetical protein
MPRARLDDIQGSDPMGKASLADVTPAEPTPEIRQRAAAELDRFTAPPKPMSAAPDVASMGHNLPKMDPVGIDLPGMEKTGLPPVPVPPVPKGLQGPPTKTFEQQMAVARYGSVPQGMDKPSSETPVQGAIRAGAGAERLAKGKGDRRANVSDIIEGAGVALMPAAIPAMLTAPVPMAIGAAAGMAAQKGVEYGAEKLGAEPETARLLGNIAGALPIVEGGMAALRGATPKPKPRVRARYETLAPPTKSAPKPEISPAAPKPVELPAPQSQEVIPSQTSAVPAAQAVNGRAKLADITQTVGDKVDMLPDDPDARKPVVARVKDGERGSIPIGALPGVSAALKATSPESRLKVRTELFDRFAPIKDLAKKAKGLTEADDPYVAARLYAGHAGKVENRLDDLRSILKPARDEGILDAMRDYALIERHEELAQRIPGYKLPKGETLQAAQTRKVAIEQQLGPQRMARVNALNDQLRAFNNAILAEAKNGGLISDAGYNAILANNQKYTPLQRLAFVADEIDNLPRGSQTFNVRGQDLVKHIQGSEKDILDPHQAIVRNVYKAISLIERNRVAQKVANLSSRPEFNGVVIPLKNAQAKVPVGMDKFSVLRGGVKQEYAVPKEVAAAMKGLNDKDIDLVTRMASKSAAALRAGATSLNLAFIPSNVVRDFQTATVASSVGFTPADWLRGFASAIRRDADFRTFRESGGSFSGYFEGNRSLPQTVGRLTESTGKRIARTVLNPIELLRVGAEAVELAPRIGVYKRAVRKGLSQEGAGYASRNATVDFARAGTSMKVFNMWVPFLNARMQGTLNLGAALARDPKSSALKLSAVVGLPLLYTYAHNQQFPEIWDDIAQFEKDNNFIIIYGDQRDEDGNPTQVVKMPKGDVGQTFANPVENFMEYLKGKDSKSFGRLMTEITSNVSPVDFEREGKFDPGMAASSLLPPTVKATMEGYTNKNFYTGRPIVPPKLEDASPKNQYRNDTPKWAVKAGAAAERIVEGGVSPLKIMNAVGTQFGGVGRQIADPKNAGKAISKRFVGARGGQQESRMFDTLREYQTESADNRVDIDRKAGALLAEFDQMPQEQRAARFQQMVQSGEMTDDLADELVDQITAKAEGLTPVERTLRRSPLDARAKFVIQELNRAPQEQRGELFQRWVEKKIITDRVADAMAEQLQLTSATQ